MKTDPLELVRAAEADIAFIMAAERLPGYEGLVGRWSEAEHRAALADSHHAYFIARRDSQPIGFAIVRDWASRERVACIKRIAVRGPGKGHGKAFLASLVDRIFRETEAYRIWLGVFPTTPARAAPTKLSASRPRALRAAAPSSAASIATS